MSGVYLTVWDKIHREKSPVLRRTLRLPTRASTLAATTWSAFPKGPWRIGPREKLRSSRPTSTASGEMRHDVLMKVSDPHRIEAARAEYFPKSDKIHMGARNLRHPRGSRRRGKAPQRVFSAPYRGGGRCDYIKGEFLKRNVRGLFYCLV